MPKKIITRVLAVVLLMTALSPVETFAEGVITTSSEVSATDPAVMQKQLDTLMALVGQLQAQLKTMQSEMTTLRESLKSNLAVGTTDPDVTKVQAILAADPTIYPSGLQTGYFGPMTKDAIMKFQAKFDLEVTGSINAETRAAFETLMEERRTAGILSPRLLDAPGLKAKFEDHLQERCIPVSTSVSGSDTSMCAKMQTKYQFGRQGSSTMPVMPPRPPIMRPMEQKNDEPMDAATHNSGSAHEDDTTPDDN